jgi:hypothetical protein
MNTCLFSATAFRASSIDQDRRYAKDDLVRIRWAIERRVVDVDRLLLGFLEDHAHELLHLDRDDALQVHPM